VLAFEIICSAGLGSAPKRGGLGLVACLLGYMTLSLDRQKALGLDRAIQTILAQRSAGGADCGGARMRGLRGVRDPTAAMPSDVTAGAKS
jgi:hypothetical protein